MGMRRFMNLAEWGHSTPMDQDEADHTGRKGERLYGTFVNPETMAQYFPSVETPITFEEAWRLVMQNREENLTPRQLEELGKAFIDFVRMDQAQKIDLMRRLFNVHLDPESSEGEEQTNSTYWDG